MFHRLRSVIFGLVADGRDLEDAVLRIDFGGRHGDAGVEVADDELDAVAGELVGDRNALLRIGHVVAVADSVIFWPMMPPAALMSSTACSAPFFSCAPKAAFGPVSGPATPILICACAVPAKAIAAPRARPSVVIFFIHFSPL